MAQAVVTHRSNQEPSEADVLARADDQQFGLLGLVDQHGSNRSARELHQPIGPGIHLVEDPCDPAPVEGFDLVMRQERAGGKNRGARRAARALALVGIVLVAVARVVLRAHWPSDAVGGIALGLALAAAAVILDEAGSPSRPPTRPPAPTPVPG